MKKLVRQTFLVSFFCLYGIQLWAAQRSIDSKGSLPKALKNKRITGSVEAAPVRKVESLDRLGQEIQNKKEQKEEQKKQIKIVGAESK